MRDVRFKSRPAPAPTAGPWQHAPLDEFALRLSPIRYALTVQRIIPSLDDLNREFMKGINDKGMSGGTEWKPFTITQDEYAELCEAFATHPRFSLRA
jgi:hypothetical protein